MNTEKEEKIRAYAKKYKQSLALYIISIVGIVFPVLLLNGNKKLQLIVTGIYFVYIIGLIIYIYNILPSCPFCGKNMRKKQSDVIVRNFSKEIVPFNCPHCGEEIKGSKYFY